MPRLMRPEGACSWARIIYTHELFVLPAAPRLQGPDTCVDWSPCHTHNVLWVQIPRDVHCCCSMFAVMPWVRQSTGLARAWNPSAAQLMKSFLFIC